MWRSMILLAGLAPALALAQTARPAQAAQAAQTAQTVRAAQPAPPARAASAPHVRVIEDDGARIEETVVNGQLQSITVQSKIGNVRPYEIVVPRGGRDPTQDKSAAGQRVWSVMRF